MARVLVTSALPYANGPIHYGHIVGAYLPADIYTRYRRMRGDDVHFVCGTDEHGVAITLRAEQEGQDYGGYVDRWHAEIETALQKVGIEFDVFTGTSHHRNPFHRALSQEFFTALLENGYLLERTEEQYFSEAKQRFLPDRYIEGTCYLCGFEKARGDECPSCGKYLDAKLLRSPTSTLDGSTPILKESRHWYLDLAKIRDEWLGEWFETKRGQWKPNVENFVRSDLAELRERPITRDLPWGVPVPIEGAEGKVLYVWFDAPIGYISISKQYWEGRGEPERFEEFWKSENGDTELYHFIGKDNITFHSVVFPSILWGAKRGWTLQTNVPANEFFNLEGRKFNTSAGWYIPENALDGVVPTDALRYALCTMMPETADSDWTWSEFQSRVNDDLADNLGNFASRTIRFLEKFFDGHIPAWANPSVEDEAVLAEARAQRDAFCDHLDHFRFRRACQALMALGNAANKYYDSEEPWVTIKDEATRPRCAQTLRVCVELLDALAILAAPALPSTSKTIRTAIARDSTPPRFETVGSTDAIAPAAVERAPLSDVLPKFKDKKGAEKTALFRKISDDFVSARRKELETMSEQPSHASEAPSEHQPLAATIEFDTFAAVDLRAGTIVAAEKHQKADRLIVCDVDLGFERRTVVAGIAASYAPEELVGKRVTVVANLAPRKLRGIESQGMLMAADDSSQKPRLISPDPAIPDGTRLS